MSRKSYPFLAVLALALCGTNAAAQQPGRASTLNLMPVPSSLTVHDGALLLDSTFSVAVVHHTDARLERAIARMIPRLEYRTGIPMQHSISHDSAAATLLIDCDGPGEAVQSANEDESYSIEIGPSSIRLHAATTVGVIRGLATVLQLVDADSSHYFVPYVSISDTPRFRWRGLLVDVSRHFEPVSAIERTLDGMSAV
ncbi:MAG: glycoside hydrolase family 20 zincin-like fold domain-containing protein, partial [Gemmatimonadales bacterium]